MLQTAPPITTENAREFQRRSTEVQRRNREARKQAELQRGNPSFAQGRVIKEINRVLTWMSKANGERHAELANELDKLWKLAYPTQGAAKAKRIAEPEDASPAAVPVE